MLRVFCFILILFILASCKKNSPQLNSEQYWVEMAEQVIIKRDIYGIPHIYGPTDESVVFGLAYARAEDHFELIENQAIRAIGRKAEIEGESGIQNDYIVRAFQFEKLSRREYQNLSEKHKRIVDAYAAGLNFYLEINPGIQPKLIKQFKPWHFLALYRRSWTSQGLSQIGVFDDDVNKYLNNAAVEPNEGSINEALKIGVMINMEDMAGQGLAWQVEKNPFIYYKGGDDGSLGIAYPDKNMIIVFTTHMKNGNHGDKIWNILGEHLFYWN